jgi:hypothetical protein
MISSHCSLVRVVFPLRLDLDYGTGTQLAGPLAGVRVAGSKDIHLV